MQQVPEAQSGVLRVAVVSGLHRSAREHAVEALLGAVPRSVAVHHDLQGVTEGVVHRVMRDRWGTLDRRVVDLRHACASCTLREDLIPLLRRLAEEGEYDLVVVDAWESVEPHAVSEAVAAEPTLRLAAVITAVGTDLVDGDLASGDLLHERRLDIAHNDDRAVAEVLSRQIEYPDVLVPCGARRRDTAVALLEQLNPAAAVVGPGPELASVTSGQTDTLAAAARSNPAWAHYAAHERGRVTTVVWTRTRPLHPYRLHEALEGIVALSLRGRGRFWLASQPETMLIWESHFDLFTAYQAGPWLASLPEAALELVPDARRTSATADWDPVVGDRRQHLAFTGLDLDAADLVARLDACLLTDDEEGMPFPTDPFVDTSVER